MLKKRGLLAQGKKRITACAFFFGDKKSRSKAANCIAKQNSIPSSRKGRPPTSGSRATHHSGRVLGVQIEPPRYTPYHLYRAVSVSIRHQCAVN